MHDIIFYDFRDLETVVSKHQPIFSHPLGHTIYLNTDISQESVGLYSSLVNSYKWWNKTHDYATGAVTVLGQNNLQRSKQSTRDQVRSYTTYFLINLQYMLE